MNPAPINLEAVMASCLGNRELVPLVLDEFAREIAGTLTQIDEHMAAGNFDSLAKAAHKLRGPAGLLQVTTLRDIAGDLEQRCRAPNPTGIDPLLNQLRDEIQRCIQWIPHVKAQMDDKQERNQCAF